MADRAERLEKRVDKIPGVDWRDVVGWAVSWFTTRQNPELVEFEKFENGYQITVRTDEENADEAREFWERHVEEKI